MNVDNFFLILFTVCFMFCTSASPSQGQNISMYILHRGGQTTILVRWFAGPLPSGLPI
jgi:hypothetical protein